jgi:hypothetical protein
LNLQCEYITSGGFAAVASIALRAHREKRRLCVVGLNPHQAKVTGLLGIQAFAEFYSSLDEITADRRQASIPVSLHRAVATWPIQRPGVRGRSLMKYHVWTEGCQMNVADSQRLESAFESWDWSTRRALPRQT